MKAFFSRFDFFYHLFSLFALLPRYLTFFIEYITFRRLADHRFSILPSDLFPQLHDRTKEHGFDRHYIYHTAWAARVLAETKTKKHVDISSSLYFTGIASAWVKFDFYDYRPAQLQLNNVASRSADLTQLHFKSNSQTSLSCMHTLEHIGLGRYGDPLNTNGDLKAMEELQRVVAKKGKLLIVVPVGKPKIMFNAHRIYSYEQILKAFDQLKLTEFSLVPDGENAHLIRNAKPSLVTKQVYACGCFWFTKP